jgi:hypothetical protein
MYDVLPSFVLAFHGCDDAVAERVFAGHAALRTSRNEYDWLGHGIYFWENNPGRAWEWAKVLMRRGRPADRPVKKSAVIGAVIDLGHCLNLLDTQFIQRMQVGYKQLQAVHHQAGIPLPINKQVAGSDDLLLRFLDCAVVEMLHSI